MCYGIRVAGTRFPSDPIWLDTAAAEVHRHPATLRRWRKEGLLKTYKRPLDRRVYVSRAELEALAAQLPDRPD